MSLYRSDKLTHLELLPPELQCQILKSIPNLKALRALIRASPQYFQVYRTCRKSILSHVAWNQITPAIVPVALNALEQRDIRLRSSCTEVFASQRMLREPHDIPFKTWERVICLHEIVGSFISNFSSSRLVALENSIQLQTQSLSPYKPPERHPDLSQIEYARLARAIYHLDLFGNLPYNVDKKRLSSYEVHNAILGRSVTFLQSLQEWELEELLCVRSYMIERLKDYLNQIEDDFMKAYLKNTPYIIWPPVNSASQWNGRAKFFSDVGYDWSQEPWIENCLSRGLENLSKMLSASTLQDKFHLPGDWGLPSANNSLSPFMSNALQTIRVHSEWRLPAEMKFPELCFHDNIEKPNKAWSWAMKFCVSRTYRTWPGVDNHDLEGWGYVIWDHERLERLGILTRR